jgi:hypothetical protein
LAGKGQGTVGGVKLEAILENVNEENLDHYIKSREGSEGSKSDRDEYKWLLKQIVDFKKVFSTEIESLGKKMDISEIEKKELKEFVSKEIGNKDTQIKLLTEKYDIIDMDNQELKYLLDGARKERELTNEEAKRNLEAVNSLCENLGSGHFPLVTKKANFGKLALKLDRVLTFESNESNLGLGNMTAPNKDIMTAPNKDIKRLLTEEMCTKLNRLSQSLTNQINDQLQDFETIDRNTQERLSKGSGTRDGVLKNNLQTQKHLGDRTGMAFEKGVTQGEGLTNRTEGSLYDHYGIPRNPAFDPRTDPKPQSNQGTLAVNSETPEPYHTRKRSTTQDLLNNIMGIQMSDHDIFDSTETPDIEKVLEQLPHIESGLQHQEKSDIISSSHQNHHEDNLLSQDTNDFLKNMNLGYGYDESSDGQIFEAAQEKDDGDRRLDGGSMQKQETGNFGLDSYQPQLVGVKSGSYEFGVIGKNNVLDSGGAGGESGTRRFNIIGRGNALESGYVALGEAPKRPGFNMVGKKEVLQSGFVADAPVIAKEDSFGMIGKKEVLQSGFVADAPVISKEESFRVIGKKEVMQSGFVAEAPVIAKEDSFRMIGNNKILESGIVMNQRQEESRPAITESINWTGEQRGSDESEEKKTWNNF